MSVYTCSFDIKLILGSKYLFTILAGSMELNYNNNY